MNKVVDSFRRSLVYGWFSRFFLLAKTCQCRKKEKSEEQISHGVYLGKQI
jgi:hypothetical protein